MSAKRQRPSLRRDPRRCPGCIVGGLTRGEPAADGRPSFVCKRCGYHFTHGKDGGEYAAAVPAPKETT